LPAHDPFPGRIALAWYFHLPSIANAIEVRDHAYRSLALLLRIHRTQRAPVLIAPTGAFLKLCLRDAPEVIDDLLDLYSSGIAEPATTYFYDVDPFSISWSHLEEQVRRDHAFKEELIGRPSAWFFAPSFAWHPASDKLLAKLGISGALLDSRHLASGATARAWKWSTDPLGSVTAIDTQPFVSPWEHRRLRTLSAGTQGTLRVVFRDWPLTRSLTFGNDAEIHKPDRDILGRLDGCEPQDLVVLADDGDRIGPASRRGYEELLEIVGGTVDWCALAVEGSQLPRLRELPAFSQPGFDELLRTSLDARAYWSLLDEIAAAPLDSAQLARLLELQDVFYPFWKGCGRRRWYLDTAVELLQEVHP
jgi:Glycosyl hydrolase family 57